MEELIRVSQVKNEVYNLADWYKSGRLYFPAFSSLYNKEREASTRTTIEALLSGIPYKQVYCFERKNGGITVLEKNYRLLNLIDYVNNRFSIYYSRDGYWDNYSSYFSENPRKFYFCELPSYVQMSIQRAIIPICLVEYNTPAGMQMRIANYVEDLTYTQEEIVRREIYSGRGIGALQNLLRTTLHKNLTVRYEAIAVKYLTYWYNFLENPQMNKWMDFYSLEDSFFDALMHRSISEFKAQRIVECLDEIIFYWDRGSGIKGIRIDTPELKKINREPLLGHFLGLALCIGGEEIYHGQIPMLFDMVIECFSSNNTIEMFKKCDMSNVGIRNFIDYLRKKL